MAKSTFAIAEIAANFANGISTIVLGININAALNRKPCMGETLIANCHL